MMDGSTTRNINKLCNVASCWIYIGILLGAHHILHISRIRVKHTALLSYKTMMMVAVGFSKRGPLITHRMAYDYAKKPIW
jgi:hypothetical protein